MKISSRHKAELFQQLSTMEHAGIPLSDAIQTLLPHKNKTLNKLLQSTLLSIKSGSAIANSGLRNGLFSDIDGLLIEAGSYSGRLADSFKNLASHYDLQTRLSQEMRSRLIFPILIFSLAVFIAPFPKFFTGAINLYEYLYITLGLLIKLGLLIFCLTQLPGWLRNGFLKNLGLAKSMDSLILKIPIIGKTYIKHNIARFIEILGMLLGSGITAHDALPKTVNTIDNLVIRDSFASSIQKLQSNSSLTDALKLNRYLPSDAILFLRTGETSGKLDETLIHYGKILRREVTNRFEQIAAWTPRIVYAMVCAYMIYSIMTSNPFMPKI